MEADRSSLFFFSLSFFLPKRPLKTPLRFFLTVLPSSSAFLSFLPVLLPNSSSSRPREDSGEADMLLKLPWVLIEVPPREEAPLSRLLLGSCVSSIRRGSLTVRLTGFLLLAADLLLLLLHLLAHLLLILLSHFLLRLGLARLRYLRGRLLLLLLNVCRLCSRFPSIYDPTLDPYGRAQQGRCRSLYLSYGRSHGDPFWFLLQAEFGRIHPRLADQATLALMREVGR